MQNERRQAIKHRRNHLRQVFRLIYIHVFYQRGKQKVKREEGSFFLSCGFLGLHKFWLPLGNHFYYMLYIKLVSILSLLDSYCGGSSTPPKRK